MAKSNKGSSYPNQGENRGTKGSNGANVARGMKSKPAKQDAAVHKGKSKKNPKLPDWLS